VSITDTGEKGGGKLKGRSTRRSGRKAMQNAEGSSPPKKGNAKGRGRNKRGSRNIKYADQKPS